jgi:hypothetical protein
MIAAASVTAWSFYKIKPVAGWLFVPYLLWLIFANYLNSVIIQLNPEVRSCSQRNNLLPVCACSLLGCGMKV